MRGSKPLTNLHGVVLAPLAALLAGLAPVVWCVACLAFIVVVLVPATLVLVLWPSLIAVYFAKDEAPGLSWPLPPCRWPCQSWLRWPWACWKWLSVADGNRRCDANREALK